MQLMEVLVPKIRLFLADAFSFANYKAEYMAVKASKDKANRTSLKHAFRTNSRGIETANQPSLQGVVFVHAKELTHGKFFSFFLFYPKSWTYPLEKKVNF